MPLTIVQIVETVLIDVDPIQYGLLPIRVNVTPLNVGIHAPGYGTACGHGSPCFLELRMGKLQLVVFGDINKDRPTHLIDLSGAKESCRQKHVE